MNAGRTEEDEREEDRGGQSDKAQSDGHYGSGGYFDLVAGAAGRRGGKGLRR